MTNSFRHGMASRIDIMFWLGEGTLQVLIRDNGKGSPSVKEGLGLAGMRERVRSIGGTVEYGNGRGDSRSGRSSPCPAKGSVTMKNSKIRLLLVDDQKLFVENLKVILEMSDPALEVIAIAENGSEAVEAAQREKPDIILMDVRMPVMDGVEATRIIHDKFPDIKIMMLTTFDDDVYVHDALANGAAGYILKTPPRRTSSKG